MKRIVIDLAQNYQRPVFKLKSLNNINVLIDTGSRIPVWLAGRSLIERAGGVDLKKKVTFGGFGGKAKGYLYCIDLNVEGLFFPKMPIIVQEDGVFDHFQMILAATNFDGTLYQVDSIDHKFNIDIPDDKTTRSMVIRKEPDDSNLFIELTEQ